MHTYYFWVHGLYIYQNISCIFHIIITDDIFYLLQIYWYLLKKNIYYFYIKKYIYLPNKKKTFLVVKLAKST